MNYVRKSDLKLPVDIALVPLDPHIPNDDELDALCDQSMRRDGEAGLFCTQAADASRSEVTAPMSRE